MDQPDFVLSAIRVSWRVWYISEFKPANKIAPDDEDDAFMTMIIPKDYRPGQYKEAGSKKHKAISAKVGARG